MFKPYILVTNSHEKQDERSDRTKRLIINVFSLSQSYVLLNVFVHTTPFLSQKTLELFKKSCIENLLSETSKSVLRVYRYNLSTVS